MPNSEQRARFLQSKKSLIILSFATVLLHACSSGETPRVINNSNITAVLNGTDTFLTRGANDQLLTVYTKADGLQYEQGLDLRGRPMGEERPTSAIEVNEEFPAEHFFGETQWFRIESVEDANGSASQVRSYNYRNAEPLWESRTPSGESCVQSVMLEDESIACATRNSLFKINSTGEVTLSGNHRLGLDPDYENTMLAGQGNTIVVLQPLALVPETLKTIQVSVLDAGNANVVNQSVLASNVAGGSLGFAAIPEAYALDAAAIYVIGNEVQVPEGDNTTPGTRALQQFVARVDVDSLQMTHRVTYRLGADLGRTIAVVPGLIDIYGEETTFSLDSADLNSFNDTTTRGEYLYSTNEFLFTGENREASTVIRRYIRGINERPATPTAPTGVRIDVYSSNSLEIFWDQPSDGEEIYTYEIRRNGDVIALTSEFNYLDVVDQPGTYEYTLTAVGMDGIRSEPVVLSATLSDATVTPTTQPTEQPTDNGPPANNAPTVAIYSGNSLELFWAADADPQIVGYKVYRNGEFLESPAGNSYFVSDLNQDGYYQYEVYVVYADGSLRSLGVVDVTSRYGVLVQGDGSNLSPQDNAPEDAGQAPADNGSDNQSPSDNGNQGSNHGPDRDGDGIPNQQDLDDDNDGILDTREGAIDHNNDGVLDAGSTDTDGDGIPDAWDLDSDNDGIVDITEAQNDYSLVVHLDVVINAAIDISFATGSNGIADVIETSPDSGVLIYTVSDADGDGVPDFQDSDSDNDGMSDLIEAGGTDVDNNGRIDTFSDADGKGVDDATQLVWLPIFDTDGDGASDYRDHDSDNDGIPDSVEAGSNPARPADSDSDGAADYREQDSDGDGVPDRTEAGPHPHSPVDSNGDGRADYTDGGVQFSEQPLDGLAPTAPGNVKAQVYFGESSGYAVEISWSASVDPDGDVHVYQVYRDGEPFASVAGHSYLDELVREGNQHTYTVEAIDNDKNRSPQSDSVTVTINR